MTLSIATLLDSRCVLLKCEYKKSDDVITAIGKRLFDAGYVRDSFVQAAIDRESQLPTGLPLAGGINAAIPHTEIEHVIRPALGMATLSNPVDFQNMVSPTEIVPVRLVFVLALEQPKAQIEMLQEVASVLQNKELVADIINQNSYEGVIELFEKTSENSK